MSLEKIMLLTKEYSDSLSTVRERAMRLEDEIETLKRRLLPGLRSAVQSEKEKKLILKNAISDSTDYFVKPRTYIFHGIKIGLAKSKRTIKIPDVQQVIKLIKKHFADKAEMLIKYEEKPVNASLNMLSDTELKRIGVLVNDSVDEVFIKSVDSDVDKLVSALLKDDKTEEEQCENVTKS